MKLNYLVTVKASSAYLIANSTTNSLISSTHENKPPTAFHVKFVLQFRWHTQLEKLFENFFLILFSNLLNLSIEIRFAIIATGFRHSIDFNY